MKVLPEKEFRELARSQEFRHADILLGFIDKETSEPTVTFRTSTRIKLHELGHERLDHLPKSVKVHGKGRKNVLGMTEPWRQKVDDEIEAEIFSFETMGKRITPRVGILALWALLRGGWCLHNALSLVIGRLKHFGVKVSYKDRIDLVNLARGTKDEIIEDYFREEYYG